MRKKEREGRTEAHETGTILCACQNRPHIKSWESILKKSIIWFIIIIVWVYPILSQTTSQFSILITFFWCLNALSFSLFLPFQYDIICTAFIMYVYKISKFWKRFFLFVRFFLWHVSHSSSYEISAIFFSIQKGTLHQHHLV